MKDNIVDAHKESIHNREKITKSYMCGCFHCVKIFKTSEITKWTDKSKGKGDYTAICPYCGVDAILPEISGYPRTEEFLEKMNKYWFE